VILRACPQAQAQDLFFIKLFFHFDLTGFSEYLIMIVDLELNLNKEIKKANK
jgi:hypothetical protein